MSWPRVRKGDGIGALHADYFNASMDHLENPHAPPPGIVAPPAATPDARQNVVLVKNLSGEARKRHDVVGIGGLVIAPADNPPHWKSNLALRAVAPDPDKPFAVLLEPIEPGKFGAAVTLGSVVARVEIVDPEHGHAVPVADEYGHFQSAAAGPVQLFHVPEETGVQETYVQIGGAAGGALPDLLYLPAAGEGGRVTGYIVELDPDPGRLPSNWWRGPEIEMFYVVGEEPLE